MTPVTPSSTRSSPTARGRNFSGVAESSSAATSTAGNSRVRPAGDKINTNPLLGPLANNGGPTQDPRVLAGSPAIDNGGPARAPRPSTSAGLPAPQGSAYDIGAYEGQATDYLQPDAMIKLSSEADAAYLTDNLYEATASVQSKSQTVNLGTAATYILKFQNDGTSTDNLVITGTGNGAGYTVQYLDNNSVDRTAAVTGAGTRPPASPRVPPPCGPSR